MNEFRYFEIKIGHEESFSVVIDQEKMEYFKLITGDINPLHNDVDFAIRGGMKVR